MSFAITIFISAFLLFQIQPVIVRYVLPWYGGSPSVWSTSMLFFQVLLLAGYAYAHLVVRVLHQKHQVMVHSILLFLSLLILPITPNSVLKPLGTEDPILSLIQLLLITVGAPYMMVSATGPLLQHWYSKTKVGKSPYRLYALSNLGSLLGLLTYPFIIEPLLNLNEQTVIWSIAYVVFVILCCSSGWLMYKTTLKWNKGPQDKEIKDIPSTNLTDVFLWLCLESTAVVILLATTNYVCQDIAVIPFLWILPLSLYLLSFIIAFDSPRWYNRWVWIPSLFLSVGIILYLLYTKTTNDYSIVWVIAMFSAAMFIAVMVCHGEIFRLKPPAKSLTAFYLVISTGGALGGVFVNFVAPYIFSGWWEFFIGFIFAFLLTGITIHKRPRTKWNPIIRLAIALVFTITVIGMVKIALDIVADINENIVIAKRNFYGILRVYNGETDHVPTKKLYHGGINHGMQFQSSKWRAYPTTYYARWSGVGVALRKHPKKHPELEKGYTGPQHNIKVGIIGLGAGTLCSYSRTGDVYRFYEINPAVLELANKQFTYIGDAKGDIQVVLGDGRISLERELEETGSHQFDVMIVDAFSGDAIPIHLLTVEAIALYLKHLARDGILAIHVSNRHLLLEPVIEGIANKLGKKFYFFKNGKNRAYGVKKSSWVLLTDNEAFIKHPGVAKYIDSWPQKGSPQVWTDDYSNLINILE